MKQADVKVGGEYLVKISGRDERVTVLREEQHTRYYAYKSPQEHTVFRVQVKATGRVLPKARTAAALRPIPPVPFAVRHAEGKQLERFRVVGNVVVRWTYVVRHEHQSWMSTVLSTQGPFAVLQGMADFAERETEQQAKELAFTLNEEALKRGTLHRSIDARAVVP
jgi:hypothetical protein